MKALQNPEPRAHPRNHYWADLEPGHGSRMLKAPQVIVMCGGVKNLRAPSGAGAQPGLCIGIP